MQSERITDIKPNGAMSDLQQDIKALRSDLDSFFKDGQDTAESKTKELMQKGNEIAKEAKVKLTDSKDKAVETVREHPLKSAGIAFGVGAILALLTRR